VDPALLKALCQVQKGQRASLRAFAQSQKPESVSALTDVVTDFVRTQAA
jgi:hypothetical protein